MTQNYNQNTKNLFFLNRCPIYNSANPDDVGAVHSAPIIRLLTDQIFLDRIQDPDSFKKLDIIPSPDPLAFSGSPIRSDLPIQLAIKGSQMFFLLSW
jgi:hypothetical protein